MPYLNLEKSLLSNAWTNTKTIKIAIPESKGFPSLSQYTAMTPIASNGPSNKNGRVITACKMSLVVRKPVFGVSDQVRHKPGCTIKEDGYRLEISDLGSGGIVLSV